MDERLKKMLGMQSMFGRQPDLTSNANLAPMPNVTFGTGQMPSGVGVTNNLQAGMPAGIAGSVGSSSSMPGGIGGDIPTTPMGQQKADALGGSDGFDFKKLATSLGEMKQDAMSTVDTSPANAGQQIQPIQIYGGGAPQMGVSGAMNAIQQGQGQMGMGGAMSPEMLRRMRGF